jgi:hypothetical protein
VTDDDRVDLTALRYDAATRAARIATRLASRVAAARGALRRRAAWDGARRLLGRLALPAVLAAAVALAGVIMTTRTRPPLSPATARPDPFAGIVLGSGPAARWVTLGHRPDVAELVTIVGGAP